MKDLKKQIEIEAKTNTSILVTKGDKKDAMFINRGGITKLLYMTFIQGAKSNSAKEFHQAGMYTEEEVRKFASEAYFKGASDQVLFEEFHTIQQHDDSFSKWFEQNKKK